MSNELTVYGGEVPVVLVNPNKGTEIFEQMLLSQYENSANLKEYIGAFIAEMDFLFQQIEEVYLGRFLERAVGAQLDVIGIILNQNRAVELPTIFFGMSNAGTPAEPMAGFANETTPEDGGLFRDESQEGFTIVPLSDVLYRRLLLAKAWVGVRPVIDINTMYFAISTILGRTPRLIHLSSSQTTVPNALPDQSILLELSQEDTSLTDVSLIEYFSKYMVPLGTSFNVLRIA